MELRTVGGRLKLGSAFRMVATGYLVGAGAIFVPLFGLVSVTLLATGAPAAMNGEVVEGGARVVTILMPFVLLPLILAGQSLIFGGVIVLGLALYRTRRPIRVTAEDTVE